jgi:signal transduction histidine kinase
LGLAITRNIVEGLGGTIHVHSEVGRGTTVEILLPGDNA